MFQSKTLKCMFVVILSLFLLASTANAKSTYKIKSTDSLNRIVSKFYKGSKLSRHQIFIGILAENPDAFNLGNINFLKRGKTLDLPDSKSLLAMEAKDATNLVAEHNNKAKKGKRVKLEPPFEDYSPKNKSANTRDINVIAEKQQAASQKLEKLDSESEALRIRLEQLEADKKAMDEELEVLNNLITE